MSKTDSIYKSLPPAIQNIAVSIYGIYWHWLRFGGNYVSFENQYAQREKLTQREWNDYQRNQFKVLCLSALRTTYYKRTWSSNEVKAAENFDLSALPLLDKNPIRSNPTDFVRTDVNPFPKLKFYTSGSTGTPLTTIWTISELRDSLAVRQTRSAKWAGVSYSLPRATFSGRMVEPDPDSKGPYYRFNAVERQVYFSAFHLKPETASSYIEALKKHKIEWMTGYANSFYILAKFVLDQKIIVPPIKAIITTSEKLTAEMRSVIQQAFNCRVFEEYSTVENALFASECEQGRLHISPDVGIVEILRPDGSPCEPGEVGEVVTTCLMRTYQPFIRYRLGDLACWDPDPCPCGRQMPVIKEVVGRIEDVVVGPDGRQMVRFHGIFTGQPHIREGQIIQESLSQITVKIVPEKGFDQSDIIEITKRVNQRLGERVKVSVDVVDSIPRTRSGKFKAVISKLSN